MWKSKPLGEIAEIEMGQSPPSDNCNTRGEGMPLLNGPTEFGPYNPSPVQYTTDVKKTANTDDLLFCVRGSTTGRMNWADQPYAIGRGIAALRHKSGSEYRYFLKGLIDYKLDNLLSAATGSTFPNVSRGQLEDLECPVPPLPKQRAIAEILGCLDDKIKLNRQMNATLEAIARAIFTSWFVDFDPVHAKARGETPAGMDAATAALFPDAFVESELGPIPAGWEVGMLGHIAKNVRRNVDPDELSGDTPYIGLGHMPQHSLALTEWGEAREVGSTKREFSKGEILFGKLRPYFHKVGIAPVDGICSTDMVVVLPKQPMWYGFSLYHLSSDEFIDYTMAVATGTRMPRTKWRDMAKYKVVIPPEDIATAYNQVVAPMCGRILSNIHESRTLANLRDTLLPKLISGELRVPEEIRQD